MINYLLKRHGVSDPSDADARAQCLSWLQRAEEAVWGYSDWWFKQVESGLTWGAGTDTYSLADARNVYALKLSTGVLLDRLAPDVFHRNFGGHGAVLDTPRVWTMLPQTESGRLLRIKVWPVPPSGLTAGRVVKDLPHRDLADDVESVSQVPADWRDVVLVWADMLMSEHFGQAELHGRLKTELDGRLGQLMAEDARHLKERG
jgi:hypothetical protein